MCLRAGGNKFKGYIDQRRSIKATGMAFFKPCIVYNNKNVLIMFEITEQLKKKKFLSRMYF